MLLRHNADTSVIIKKAENVVIRHLVNVFHLLSSHRSMFLKIGAVNRALQIGLLELLSQPDFAH